MTEMIPVIFHSEDEKMEDWQQTLAARIPGLQLVRGGSSEAARAEVMIAWAPPAGMMAEHKALKGVISLAQGVDHILCDPDMPGHLKLGRLVDPFMSHSMAEWVMLAILEQHLKSATYAAAEARGDWIRLAPPITAETTVAVMGIGAIGGHVAKVVAGFGFPTLGWSRSPKDLPGVICVEGQSGFEHCLAEADYIVSILPLTADTENIYDQAAFSMMKQGAFFINAGRGRQVDEAALQAAIDRGHLAGATLDVFFTEPLPQGHGFWTHPKIRVWPHVSAQTNPFTAADQVAASVRAIIAGEEPLNSVSLERGY